MYQKTKEIPICDRPIPVSFLPGGTGRMSSGSWGWQAKMQEQTRVRNRERAIPNSDTQPPWDGRSAKMNEQTRARNRTGAIPNSDTYSGDGGKSAQPVGNREIGHSVKVARRSQELWDQSRPCNPLKALESVGKRSQITDLAENSASGG